MCTLSMMEWNGGLRLAFNRDERRTRPAALPPQTHRFSERLAILPIDPASGGTWIAVNDARLAFAILNFNLPDSPRRAGAISRGCIIPQLLHHIRLVDACNALGRMEHRDYSPFRLVLTDTQEVTCFTFDGVTTTCSCVPVARGPLLFTSSGLGDTLVQAPRRALFDSMSLNSPRRQDEFHHHRWVERPHLSVFMARPDACTVSYSVIELCSDRITFHYHDHHDQHYFRHRATRQLL